MKLMLDEFNIPNEQEITNTEIFDEMNDIMQAKQSIAKYQVRQLVNEINNCSDEEKEVLINFFKKDPNFKAYYETHSEEFTAVEVAILFFTIDAIIYPLANYLTKTAKQLASIKILAASKKDLDIDCFNKKMCVTPFKDAENAVNCLLQLCNYINNVVTTKKFNANTAIKIMNKYNNTPLEPTFLQKVVQAGGNLLLIAGLSISISISSIVFFLPLQLLHQLLVWGAATTISLSISDTYLSSQLVNVCNRFKQSLKAAIFGKNASELGWTVDGYKSLIQKTMNAISALPTTSSMQNVEIQGENAESDKVAFKGLVKLMQNAFSNVASMLIHVANRIY